MVNVDGNFNRNYEHKRKAIRDKKRARVRGQKRLFKEAEVDEPKTKKQIKKEMRKQKMLKEAGMTSEDIKKLINYRKDRNRKKRQKQKEKKLLKASGKQMEVDEEDEK